MSFFIGLYGLASDIPRKPRGSKPHESFSFSFSPRFVPKKYDPDLSFDDEEDGPYSDEEINDTKYWKTKVKLCFDENRSLIFGVRTSVEFADNDDEPAYHDQPIKFRRVAFSEASFLFDDDWNVFRKENVRTTIFAVIVAIQKLIQNPPPEFFEHQTDLYGLVLERIRSIEEYEGKNDVDRFVAHLLAHQSSINKKFFVDQDMIRRRMDQINKWNVQ